MTTIFYYVCKSSVYAVAVVVGLAISAGTTEKCLPSSVKQKQLLVAPLPHSTPDKIRKVLQKWEEKTAYIKNIKGDHHRIILNHTFKTEMQSRGRFFYEAPDKGRLEIEPIKLKEGTRSKRIDKKRNQPYDLMTDRPETFIFDGKFYWEMDNEEKFAVQISRDKSSEGELAFYILLSRPSLVDFVCPCVLGGSADELEQRFNWKLIKPLDADDRFIWLEAQPRWEQDLAVYQSINLRLDKRSFLPSAVKTTGVGGNLSRTYLFENLVVNEIDTSAENPFIPDLTGFEVRKPLEPKKLAVPNVLGLHGKNAQKLIEDAGLKVKWVRGPMPPEPKYKLLVYEQCPKASEKLEKGSKVKLTLYYDPPSKKRNTK